MKVISAEIHDNGAPEKCPDIIPAENEVSTNGLTEIHENGAPEECSDIIPSENEISTNGLTQADAEVEQKPKNETDGAKVPRKNDDSLSDTVGDVSRSPATDKDSSGVESEGFNEDPIAELKGEVSVQSTTYVQLDENVAKKTMEDKIVPGAICRGVDLLETSPK